MLGVLGYRGERGRTGLEAYRAFPIGVGHLNLFEFVPLEWAGLEAPRSVPSVDEGRAEAGHNPGPRGGGARGLEATHILRKLEGHREGKRDSVHGRSHQKGRGMFGRGSGGMRGMGGQRTTSSWAHRRQPISTLPDLRGGQETRGSVGLTPSDDERRGRPDISIQEHTSTHLYTK